MIGEQKSLHIPLFRRGIPVCFYEREDGEEWGEIKMGRIWKGEVEALGKGGVELWWMCGGV